MATTVLSSVSSISISPLPLLRLFPKSPISIRISASSDVQPRTDPASAEGARKHVEVLKTAAKTRRVPSSEILSAFAAIEENAPSEIDLSTLGGTESPGRTWMLVFTAQSKSLEKGSYFPITAVQRFDGAGKRIENGVYFGGLGCLSFEGRLSWKKRILAFVFERVRIKVGPFGPLEINLGEADSNREPSNKDPFFIWFYVDEEIAVARGKSGGTAFWCRCARAV